jgi:uncharacterized protein involved in exopolysaccharide biosynthesis
MAQIDTVGQGLRALRRHARLAVALFVLGCAISLGVALKAPRVYEVTAAVQIETPAITIGNAGRGGPSIASRISLIEQKLKSHDTLEQIITDFDLFDGPEDIPMVQRVSMLREAVRITRMMDRDSGWGSSIQPTGLLITVRMDDAQTATDLANSFLDMVMLEGRTRATTRADSTLSFFSAEEQRVTNQIAEVENSIAALKAANLGALPEAADTRNEQLGLLREAQLSLEQQIITFERGRDRLRDDEATRQDAILRQQSQLIADRINEVQALNDVAPEIERQLNLFERNRNRLQDEYTAITLRRAEAAMTQELESRDQSDRFEVLERALVPEYPVSQSRRKLLMAGVFASLFGAIGAVLALEWISPNLRTALQIERATGLRPIVVIPELTAPRRRRNRSAKHGQGFRPVT